MTIDVMIINTSNVQWNLWYEFIIFILSRFRSKLLATNHLIKQERPKFDTEQKSSKFLLEIKTLVSLENNIGSDIEFILRGR